MQPPSGTHAETVDDVQRAVSAGGAILAWEDRKAVGSARFNKKPDHFYVGRVAVLPAFRGKGIASAMMAYLEDLAREVDYHKVQIGVRMALPQNLAFYQGRGYQVVSVDPHEKAPNGQIKERSHNVGYGKRQLTLREQEVALIRQREEAAADGREVRRLPAVRG